MPLQGDPAGHDRPQPGDAARPRRPGLPQRRPRRTLTAREGKWAQITMPSGEVRRLASECRATIGMIGNAEHMNISLGKAGRKRQMGRKPHNRGTSMNPVSHPMGGGEGAPPAAGIRAARPACWPRAARRARNGSRRTRPSSAAAGPARTTRG